MNDRERNQSGQEQAVKQFLRDFLDKTKDEQTLNRILQDVGGYYDADRAYRDGCPYHKFHTLLLFL